MSEKTPPTGHLSKEEIEQLLRGFPEEANVGAKALRESARDEDLKSCLYGVLMFYLPAGTTPPEDEPGGETKLADELGLDSLSMAEAMFKVEELFDIRVENAELAEIVTLSDAFRLVKEKLEDSSTVIPDE